MLGGAVLRHATINLTDNSQIQSLTFNNRVMKLTSAAAFCFITLLAQIFSVSLAVGSSARKKNGMRSQTLLQHFEFYAVSQDFLLPP